MLNLSPNANMMHSLVCFFTLNLRNETQYQCNRAKRKRNPFDTDK